MKLKDLLEECADKEVEIVTGIDDFLDKLGAIMEDESEEKDERPTDDELEECRKFALEECRKSALEAKNELIKRHGKEKAEAVVEFAGVSTEISACLDLNIPIRQEWVDEYNKLVEKVHPEVCDSFLLPFTYMAIEKTKEDGVKSLDD